jgi:large subunit ribosomal protein L21
MYAIFRTGGKQYKVEAGDTVRVEKLERSLGDTFDLGEVLMVGGDKTFIGAPLVTNAKVTAVVTRHAKAGKIIVFKKKRRQGYRRTAGHRQLFTELFIKSITTPEGQKVETDKSALIIDPVKIEARKSAHAEKVAAQPRNKAALAAKAAGVEAKAPKKKVAKKASAKKAGAKKASAKKTTTKRPAGGKAGKSK